MTAGRQHINSENLESAVDQPEDFLIVVIAGQRFGIPILQVQNVLSDQSITKIPLAPPEVAGSFNLRGRIVTAINIRSRFGIESHAEKIKEMSVVVEHNNELYSLIIDRVGDIITMENTDFENNSATLAPVWRDISSGVYRLENELLVVLDVPKLLDTVHN